MTHKTRNIKFTATKSSGEVSGLLLIPEKPKYVLVFSHGAGAGMRHPFMDKISFYLADEGIGTLRYNFPYIEKKKKGPDPAAILMETVRSAVKEAVKYAEGVPVLAGGKSMGGRMTSMAASDQNKTGMESVKGIVFFGFPLHAPGKPSNERAEHLFNVKVPMLFLQGTRDKLADLKLLKPIVKKLKDRGEIYIIEGGDHSFHLPKSSGRTDEDVLKEIAKKAVDWGKEIINK